ncbi:MAG: Transcription antitermination protein RfaH [Betaproteobacteria bacterium ADurb.Bin341]|nr:MAG: Transcription antitermination protein RfaH [Betaproteobacteria bacterium ADurb.Bin341]
MHWYVVHTKPRQEKTALLNLEQQGYECYLPLLPTEKIRQGGLAVVEEPLFPRYLFIRLDAGASGKSWGPIRSTRGVSRLVTFGTEPAKVAPCLIDTLRLQDNAGAKQPLRLFKPGDRVVVTNGPFAGIEVVYQMSNGESRAMVLLEMLSKPVTMHIAPVNLRKVG